MPSYTRISLEERERIYSLHITGKTVSEISIDLLRHKSSISRELSRCKENVGGYSPHKAHQDYSSKLSRNKELLSDSVLREYIIDKLTTSRWSPEQISGRLGLGNGLKYACKETIYKFIYSKEGLSLGLPAYLRQKRKRRGHRKSRKTGRCSIPNLISIHDRPKLIERRKQFGNWEGDLMLFGITNPRNITTLVERKTRFTKLVANTSKRSKEVISGIKEAFRRDRQTLRSITFDRGSEFAGHQSLMVDTYFCDPASPWQKGSVENINGRIRHLMPRNQTPRLFRQEHLDYAQNLLNNTPRKLLGYKTPQEAYSANLRKLARSCCARC